MSQTWLGDLPLSEKEASEVASDYILGNIGNIPNAGHVRLVDDKFIVNIEVSYPRIILDDTTNEPRKIRFINVGKVGEIVIDRMKGAIIDKPRFYDIQFNIQNKLSTIMENIEKALVKIGSNQFANLHFPAHMHTPMIDVISWLLIRDSLNVSELELLYDDDKRKYLIDIELLEKIGLVQRQENIVLPGNILVGIENEYRNQGHNKQLTMALAYFYKEGYNYIDSIRQVLGPHLAISSVIYERAIENDEIVPLSIKTIEFDFFTYYKSEKKRIKIPRYLLQLEDIGLIDSTRKGGSIMWQGKEEVFDVLRREEISL